MTEQATIEPEDAAADSLAPSAPVGAHLVGSVPLGRVEEVFRRTAEALGDRLRRLPDGEPGPRSDWILWQYPVFSALPQFEVGPPGDGTYRTLPKLRLRDGERADDIVLDNLGFADAAISSFAIFAKLKRDGVIPAHVRFQVSLPTPLAPVSAFIDPEHQALVEPVYEACVLRELDEIFAAVPHDQLALQWDTRLEFAILEGISPAWFEGTRAGVLERLLRISRGVPADVELGFHLCYGDDYHGHFNLFDDTRKLVEVANALATALYRPLNWIHVPVPASAGDEYFAPLQELRLDSSTELYLGVLHLQDGKVGARRRIACATRYVQGFGVATDCGWGRGGSVAVDELLELHRATCERLEVPRRPKMAFAWPEGFDRIPDEDWTRAPISEQGLAYDHVDEAGWYDNLNPSVAQLAAHLQDGDILVDYSGGTGILLDRLHLRIFDRAVGTLVVDASAKFLRVAHEKYKDDPRFAARLLRFIKEEKRLQSLDEVLGPELLERGVDVIAAVNAIHLYPDLDEVASAWVRALKPGGKVFINSGNLRNPSAKPGEWILDETVWVINDLAESLVRSDPEYAQYRDALDDAARLSAHHAHRDRVFLQPRPLEYYTGALERNGLTVVDVSQATIVANVSEWFDLMIAYHEAVLGWVGGTKRIEGDEPSEEAVRDRLRIMRHAIDTIFGSRDTFKACWTYITATKGG
ncbi:MAG TPA: class I SAM-dependent methyltransferase [Solirubrobacteraceae bacterium]|nr:class I SAM-dependent methyltransferase [Solirubrobacteraceae bacterium]